MSGRDARGPVIGAAVDPPATAQAKLGSGGQRIAVLLPLSGPRAELATPLSQAVQLALDTPGAPPYDKIDTAGTAEGAAEAARRAIAQGAGIIVGPLSSTETAAVAPIAGPAGVPVLAFTNDPARAAPGVWPLGIGPAQQVYRLASALNAQGKSRIAGLLPESEFGSAMALALTQTAAALGQPEPTIRRYPSGAGVGALNPVIRELSNYAGRRGPIEAERRAASASGTAEGRRRAAEIGRRGVPPAPFDALLLADSGEIMESLAALLAYYDVDPAHVRVLGPSSWAAPNSGAAYLRGAWFAAPDPAARTGFESAFSARFGGPPPALADIAFDAASIARVAAAAGGYTIANIARADGYIGANGLVVLQPDGQVRRGLAIFEVQRGGPQMIEPPPQSVTAPGA